MAKKSGGPQKTCVKCGKSIHARTTKCPHCKAEQPIKAKSAKPKKVKGQDLTGIVEKIQELGGLSAIKSAVADYERVQTAIDAFGGYDRAKELLTLVEAIKGLK